MRAPGISVFYTAWLTGLAISLPLRYTSGTHNIPVGRDLLGLLGDVEDGYTTAGPSSTPTLSLDTTRIDILTELGKTSGSATSTLTSATIDTRTQSLSVTEKSVSATTTIKASTSKSSSVPALATHETVPYNTADTTEAPSTPPGELTEWKVIGIAVITITFIATVVLLVSFFDSWWGFVRAAVCGKSRKGDMSTRGLVGETLVPDWEKRSWEFRLASEDGHRYPTMSSLGSVVQEKEGVLDEPGWGEHDIKSPEMAYGGI